MKRNHFLRGNDSWKQIIFDYNLHFYSSPSGLGFRFLRFLEMLKPFGLNRKNHLSGDQKNIVKIIVKSFWWWKNQSALFVLIYNLSIRCAWVCTKARVCHRREGFNDYCVIEIVQDQTHSSKLKGMWRPVFVLSFSLVRFFWTSKEMNK